MHNPLSMLVGLRQIHSHDTMTGMAMMIDMRVSELLMARLCHDLAGPIAAIGNGAELLEDDDPDFARQAATLIGDSAGAASKRLQLFRFAYGFSDGALAGPPPHLLAGQYFSGGAIACDYAEAARGLDAAWQRLGCNLLMIAAEALPRGGKLALLAEGGGIAVSAQGDGTGPSAEASGAMTLASPVEALTPRTVGAYFAGLLAKMLDRRLRVAAAPGGFRIVCEAGGA
ncbi:MAG: histidine phosphotransferase family protein [Stellaceae bacterium]